MTRAGGESAIVTALGAQKRAQFGQDDRNGVVRFEEGFKKGAAKSATALRSYPLLPGVPGAVALRLGVPGGRRGVGTPTAVTLRSFTFIPPASPASPSGLVAESTRLSVRSRSTGSLASAADAEDGWAADLAWESSVLVVLPPPRAGPEERDRRCDDNEAKK